MQTQNYDELLRLFPNDKETLKKMVQANLRLLTNKAAAKACMSLEFSKWQITINSTEDLNALRLSLGLTKTISV